MKTPKEMPKPTNHRQKLEMLLRSRMDLSRDGAEWATFFECDYERE